MALTKPQSMLRACDAIGALRRKPKDSQRIVNAASAVMDFAGIVLTPGDAVVAAILAEACSDALTENRAKVKAPNQPI